MGERTFSVVSQRAGTSQRRCLASSWRGKESAVRSSFQLREIARPMEKRSMITDQPSQMSSGRLERQIRVPDFGRLKEMAADTVPALLFGLRLWASVCLALYIAFWLELDSP